MFFTIHTVDGKLWVTQEKAYNTPEEVRSNIRGGRALQCQGPDEGGNASADYMALIDEDKVVAITYAADA